MDTIHLPAGHYLIDNGNGGQLSPYESMTFVGDSAKTTIVDGTDSPTTITDSTVSDNQAATEGGGVFVYAAPPGPRGPPAEPSPRSTTRSPPTR